MCGIVGIVKSSLKSFTKPDIDLFKNMLIADSVRGWDSTGMFTVDHLQNVEFVKIAAHPFNLFSSQECTDVLQSAYTTANILVGHNRRATEGSIKNENAHPFVAGPIVLVHNGHINNFRSLIRESTRTNNNIEVDSHGIAWMLSQNQDNPEHVLNQLNGAWAIVWYNSKTGMLSFARNNERPLHYCIHDNMLMFSSERGMLSWLKKRTLSWQQLDELKKTNKGLMFGEMKPFMLNQLTIEDGHFKWSYKQLEKPKENYHYMNNRGFSYNPVVPHAPVREHVTPTKYINWDSAMAKNDINRKTDTPMRETLPIQLINIPKHRRWNIHYGHDMAIVKRPYHDYQQIVWCVDDCKEVGTNPVNGAKVFQLWGAALESKYIEVSTCVEAHNEKHIESLMYAQHVISFVEDVLEGDDKDSNKFYKVIVNSTRTVELIEVGRERTLLTKSHYEYLTQHGDCSCAVRLGGAEEIGEPSIMYALNEDLHDVVWQCSWCADADNEATKLVVEE